MREYLIRGRVRRLVEKAEQLMLRESPKVGLRIAEEAYELARGGVQPDTFEYVLSAGFAGAARFSAGDIAGAEAALKDALRFADKALKDDQTQHAAILNNLSILYFRSQRAKLSIPLMEEAIAIKRRL